MNAAAYWIFMNYEATRLVPLFHLKLILTGTWTPVTNTIRSVVTLKAHFGTLLKLMLHIQPDFKVKRRLIYHNRMQDLICVHKVTCLSEGSAGTCTRQDFSRDISMFHIPHKSHRRYRIRQQLDVDRQQNALFLFQFCCFSFAWRFFSLAPLLFPLFRDEAATFFNFWSS